MSADPETPFPNLPDLRKHLAAPSLAATLTDAGLAATSAADARTRLEAIVDAQLAAERNKVAQQAGETSEEATGEDVASDSDTPATTTEVTGGPESGVVS